MHLYAAEVAIVRDGTTTVLSVQTDYEGPPEAFVLEIPVPASVAPGDVKTVPREIFARLSALDGPRLVEYWEQDPCASYEEHSLKPVTKPRHEAHDKPGDDSGAPVQGQFVVGQYQVSITDGRLVAKFEGGRATLDALQVRYDSPSFALPVGLGVNELVVHVLAKGQRYEVKNHPNVSLPTNLDVDAAAKSDFGPAYAALFDDLTQRNPGAVVTEYSWDARACDPCPGTALSPRDLVTLGAASGGGGYVLTRLHASHTDDLVFRAAPPISGGREFRSGDGVLETGARLSSVNQFQSRYAIRHAWTGPVACDHPARGHWGGAQPLPVPPGFARDPSKLALFPTLAMPQVETPPLPSQPAVVARPPSTGCTQGASPPLEGFAAVGVLVFLWRRKNRS